MKVYIVSPGHDYEGLGAPLCACASLEAAQAVVAAHEAADAAMNAWEADRPWPLRHDEPVSDERIAAWRARQPALNVGADAYEITALEVLE